MAEQYEFVSTEGMLEEAAAEYEALTGRTLNAADPDRLFLSWAVSALLSERARANYIGNQNIPSRAEGENLDALAEFFYLPARPEAASARCTVRFTLTAAQDRAILVPAGTRVTDAGQTLFWETSGDVYIAAGSLYADGEAVCQTAGTVGNGWAAGTLTVLVDPYAFSGDPANVTETGGGADRATDAEFYALMRSSMNAYSSAGPRGAYEYHAAAASGEIGDVRAIRPAGTETATLPLYALSGVKYAFLGGESLLPGTLAVTGGEKGTDYEVSYENGLLAIEIKSGGALASADEISVSVDRDGAGLVEVYALMKDGTPASESVKALILAACSADTVRPLTDKVTVKDPVAVTYNVDLTYYVPREAPEGSAAVEAAVAEAVLAYETWQSGALGRDINPSRLVQMLMEAGLKRVAVVSPVFTELKDGSDGSAPEYAKLGTVSVKSGGKEDW